MLRITASRRPLAQNPNESAVSALAWRLLSPRAPTRFGAGDRPMMRTPALILAITLSLSLLMVLTAARANASQPTTPHLDRCLEEASTQLAMNDCADRERKLADHELRRLWREVAKATGAPAKLKREQRTWMKTRKQRCRQEAALHEGGSIMPLVFA